MSVKRQSITQKIYFFAALFLIGTLFFGCAVTINGGCPRAPFGKDQYVPVGPSTPILSTIYVHPPKDEGECLAYNDPYYPLQWQLKEGQMDIVKAHSYTMGDPSVIVWILDTGTNTNLPDFFGAKFIKGHNYVEDNDDTSDRSGHGTTTASIICMQPNNKIGGVGVAPGSTIGIMRVIPFYKKARWANSSSDESPVNVAKAIVDATDFCVKNHRPGVINMSLGVYTHYKKPYLVQAAIAYARRNGVLCICAAGNDFGMDDHVGWPAYFPEAVAIGSSSHDDSLAFYSNSGFGMDMTAPGGSETFNQEFCGYTYQILVSRDINFCFDVKKFYYKYFNVPKEEPPYFLGQGTSYAAPQVSGTVALILSLGITDPNTVLDIIHATLRKPEKYEPCFYGRGILNTGAAVELAFKIKHGQVTLEQLKSMPKGLTLEESLDLLKKDYPKRVVMNPNDVDKIVAEIRATPVDSVN